MSQPADPLDRLADLLAKAKAAGADAADAVLADSVALSHAQRLGNLERLEREESQDLGLRVLIGRRQAIVSSSDTDPRLFAELAERAVAMARSVPEDEFCGLADPDQLAQAVPDLDTHDPVEPAPELLIERARACEDAARAVAGITNSEGAEASWSSSRIALAASNGFAGSYRVSRHGIGTAVVAGQGLDMQRDYDFTSTVYGADLEDPEAVGRRAGEKAVKRLGARKVSTVKVPVVYDPRISGGLIGHLASAINGVAVARGTSFLKDKMGEQVAGAGITVVDDPHRARGLRSKPFDAEGVANRRREMVSGGRLESWILDLRSSRQLGLATTGHASPRHLRPAGAGCHQPLPGARPRQPRGPPQGRRRRLLRGRADRHGGERRHRRLQPRRGRLLDREGRAHLPGAGGHGRRQPERDVQGHDPGQRPRFPLRRERTDAARGRGDRGGGLRGALFAVLSSRVIDIAQHHLGSRGHASVRTFRKPDRLFQNLWPLHNRR